MNRPAFAALAMILPVTLGLRSIEHVELTTDSQRVASDAASMLAANGWSVQRQNSHLVGWMIEAQQGHCRMLIHPTPPGGATVDMFRRLAHPIGQVTFHYRGVTSDHFPRFVPMLAEHAQKYAWSFGVAIPTEPVIASAQSPSCSAPSPHFNGLRQHLKAAKVAHEAVVET